PQTFKQRGAGQCLEGRGLAWIGCNGFFEERARGADVFSPLAAKGLLDHGVAAEIVVVSGEGLRWLAQHTIELGLADVGDERPDDLLRDLVLNGKHVGRHPIVVLGPNLSAVGRIYKLGADAQSVP